MKSYRIFPTSVGHVPSLSRHCSDERGNGDEDVTNPIEDKDVASHKDGRNDLEDNIKSLQRIKEREKEDKTVTTSSSSCYIFPQSKGISKDLFCLSKYLYPITRKLILYSILVLLALLIFLGNDIYDHNFLFLTETNNNDELDRREKPTYRLTFIGDSLIHRPFSNFDLGGRLQRHFKTIHIDITDRSVEGNTIARCRKTIVQDVPPGSADMVILLWDTDVSDSDESAMTAQQVIDKRAKYLQDLTYVMNVTKAAGVKHIAMSGPNLLGEGPDFQFLLPSYMVGKEKMLEEYVLINKKAAKDLKVDYIDMRQVFLDRLPSSWVLPIYYLTVDGERPNKRGSGIIAQEFAKQISLWTGAPTS